MVGIEPFIPLTRNEVILLVADALPLGAQQEFGSFAKLLSAWYHHTYHAHLERLKSDYEHLEGSDPDDVTARRFADSLDAVARAANFSPIAQSELTTALAEESVFRLRLHVDFSDFREIVFYGRGISEQSASVATWFGLRRQQVQFTNYRRVLVFIRFQDSDYFRDRDDVAFEPGSVVLKLFENVPKADLEMLFPNIFK